MAGALTSLDPLLSHELRLALVQKTIGKSKLKRFIARVWPSAGDLGVLLSLLLVGFGVRQRRAVIDAAVASHVMVKAGIDSAVETVKRISSRDGISSMVETVKRISSRDGISSMVSSLSRENSRENLARMSPGQEKLSSLSREGSRENISKMARGSSFNGIPGQTPLNSPMSSPRLSFSVPAETGLVARGQTGLIVRLADRFRRHFDRVILAFIASKLALLVLYTMPVSYFFGVKRAFLQWASRAAAFRLYMRLLPVASFGLVAAGSLVARFSSRPLRSGTVQRWQSLALLNTVLSYCTVRLFELIRGDARPVIQVEETAEDRDLLAVKPPPLQFLRAVTAPQRQFQPPVFLGLENLPVERRRLLLVGNHCIWGLDTLLLLHGIYEHAGIWARPLGEHSWFALPGVGGAIKFLGAVDGTRHNCDLLMKQGENMLVYPGGARESWKRTTDPRYGLLWQDHHLGFVAMALRHGYTIVPVASVGTEDVFTPAYDMPLEKMLTLGGLLPAPKPGTSKAFDKDAKLPLLRFHAKEAQRAYFRFMPPITTLEYAGAEEDNALKIRLRDETRKRLEEGISELLKHRETDPERFVWKKDGRQSQAKRPAAEVPPRQARL